MRTLTQPPAPAAPQPPATTVPSAIAGDPVTVTTVTGQGVAATAADAQINTFTYSQLRARGEELSRQLNSATGRRDELIRDLRRAPEAVRDGMQQQINELSGRILQIERDIAQNGRQLAITRGQEAPAGTTSRGSGPPSPGFQMDPDDVVPIAVVFTLFVLCPIALSFSRMIWKRGSRPMAAPMSNEAELRLQRVEEGVEAIAVEVERISEGQRFVTQLMAPSQLGQGAAQPVRVPVGEPVPTSWQQR
ncbi:MAG: hypothetical protein ACO1Q7_01375 [Gemmatimonas sp.]